MSEPKMTAEERLGEWSPQFALLHKRVAQVMVSHAAAAVADAEKRWMLDRARCECSPDVACRFARERDEALARIAELETKLRNNPVRSVEEPG